MKKLIISGCSWSDKNYHSLFHPELDCSWTKWPEMLAEKLGMECINLAKSGAGSEFIYNTLMETVCHTNNIGLVIASWSKSERRDWQEPDNTWSNSRFDEKGTNRYWIQRHLRYYYSFQILCEYLQVPYKQFQMLKFGKGGHLTNKIQRQQTIVAFGTNPMIHLINENNFIGWPTFDEYGGFDVQTKFIKRKDRRYEISNEDSHPNAKGHKLIADFIYENI